MAASRSSSINKRNVFAKFEPKIASNLLVAYFIDEWGIVEEDDDEFDDEEDDEEYDS